MKNVRFEFTDADYELVTNAYKQYEKLAKDYDHKNFLFELLVFATIPIGFLVFSLAQRIINARFVGLINLIIIVCTIILYALFIMQSSIYTMKRNLTKKYEADCLDIKNNMEEARKTSGRLEFEIDTTYDGIIETNKLFYRIYKPPFAIRRYPVIENEIPYTDNIVLRLKKTQINMILLAISGRQKVHKKENRQEYSPAIFYKLSYSFLDKTPFVNIIYIINHEALRKCVVL